MQILSGSTLRRLLPAIAVSGVLVVSYLAPSASLAASDVGYGYANNCGVKGDGFHDHGKKCPNRPFPGHGNGVLDILSGISPSSERPSSAHSENHDTTGTSTVTGAETSAGSDQGVTSSGRHHGRGHAKGHANNSPA